MPWRFRIFALDIRALALARIYAGTVLLIDLLLRARFLREFMSDEGFYPRKVLMESYRSFPLPTLHIANDTLLYQYSLIIFHMFAAVSLILGYRTRFSSFIAWFFLVSIHLRNSLVLNSGDTLFAALLFWGMFLPWGRVWSLDSRRGSPNFQPLAGRGRLYFSAATVGLVLQMVCLYLFAALHKIDPLWLSEGSAVYYSLSVEHHATSWAHYLLAYPWALRYATWGVLATEWSLAVLLLAPWPALRGAVLVGAALMHLGFGAFLEIGIFRWAPLVGLLAMAPSGFLNSLIRRGEVFEDSQEVGVEDEMTTSFFTFFMLFVIALTWAMNLESLGKGKPVFVPKPLIQIAPMVSSLQFWRVFTGEGLKEDGWFSIEVTTRGGHHYDPWLDGRAFRKDKPPLVSATYPDDRWRKWMMNLPSLPDQDPAKGYFARWWLEQWNRTHHGEESAVMVKVWHVREPTLPDNNSAPPTWILVCEAKS